MNSIITKGLQGVKTGFEIVNREAERTILSFQSESEIDPIEPLVGLKIGKQQVEASAKVIKVGDDLNKTILDILA